MVDVVLILVLALILGGAAGYVWKVKKAGKACIGCTETSCPHRGTTGCTCGSKKGSRG